MKNIVDALCEGDAAPGFDVPEEAEEVQLAKEIFQHAENIRTILITGQADEQAIATHADEIKSAADQLMKLHIKPDDVDPELQDKIEAAERSAGWDPNP